MTGIDIYYSLLGLAAVISALTQRSSNKALKAAIDDMKRTLNSHDERLRRLEGSK